MEQETTTLILNTFDISKSTTPWNFKDVTVNNQYGTIANNRCNLTWKNINMRRVLGEMYDKYETFNMYLYQINQSASFSSLSPSTNNQLLVDVRIKGLSFINSTYNIVSRNNTNTAHMTSYVLNNTASNGLGIITPLYNPTILTFGKNAEYVDITIEMKSTYKQDYPTIVEPVNQGPPNSFGTFIFMFKFYGILSKDKNVIINGSRMNLKLK